MKPEDLAFYKANGIHKYIETQDHYYVIYKDRYFFDFIPFRNEVRPFPVADLDYCARIRHKYKQTTNKFILKTFNLILSAHLPKMQKELRVTMEAEDNHKRQFCR